MTALLAGGAMFAPLGSHSAVLHSEISPDAASRSAPPLRVMNIGESVVVGHQLIPGSYRLPLRQAFIEGGCEVTFVGHNTENSPAGYDNLLRHDGERGWYIHEFTERIVGWVNSQQPDVVFVYAGIKDVRFLRDGAPDRLNELVSKIMQQAPNARVYVSNIKIVNPPADVTAATQYNVAIQQKMQALANSGKKVHWVSQADVLNPSTDFVANDPLHPNGAGSAKMADAWFNAARPHVCPNAAARQIGQSPPVPSATPTRTPTATPAAPTPTPTVTRTPTETLIPTDTPTPTETPEGYELTPRPSPSSTVTPLATPTPSGSVTPIRPSSGTWFTYLQFLQHDGSTPTP